MLCGDASLPPARCEHRPLPPLRDWKPTLLRAHQDVIQWSSRLDAMLPGPLPRETDRTSTMDDMFVSLITIFRMRAPSQRQHPRHKQPAWWTPGCFEACVARNGAWRDFRRTQDPRDRSRFRAARVHFHSIVRSSQASFWSHWQDLDPSLSRVNPRAAFPPWAIQTGSDTLCPLASKRGSFAAVVAALHVRWSSTLELF